MADRDLSRPFIGYRPAGRRPESQQGRAAAANAPLAALRGMVSGVLGAPGDIESLVRLLPGLSEQTMLPTSEDIEKRLPLRSVSETPAGRAFTTAGQLGGGFYTGPGSPLRAVAALPSAVSRAGRDFVQAAGQPAVNVIKPKGGNFLTGSVEKAVEPLKTRTIAGETPAQRIPRHEALLSDPSLNKDQIDRVLYQLEETKKEAAIDQWIDRNLTNYIKKEMATPEDPVRKLAEQGIVHIPSEQVGTNRYKAPERRTIMGGEQLGQSEAARAWEDASDVGLRASRIRDLSGNYKEPWMENADPSTKIYSLGRETDSLGFDHIVDVLKQDLAAGRIRPEQLSKVSMEQAVRRTYDFDQEMAKKMREAQIKATEGMPVHKEYPEGYRWVELGPGKELPEGWTTKNGAYYDPKGERHVHPDSEKVANALKYEGETMGHCVGGYCPDVLEGRSRIYSLRDAKGEPHVTVEVRPGRQLSERDLPDDVRDMLAEQYGDASREEFEAAVQAYLRQRAVPDEIVQIKGKANKAPKEEYLPFVQDFVKSQQWGRVGDLHNTGMVRFNNAYVSPAELEYKTDDGWRNLLEFARERFPDSPNQQRNFIYGATDESGAAFIRPVTPVENFAAGGLVKGYQAGGIAKVVKKTARSLGDLVDEYVRKVRRFDELGEPTYDVPRKETPVSADVPGWHITQDLPAILKSGSMNNRLAGANMQGWEPAHVGGAYFYSDPRLALAQHQRVLEMVGSDPGYAAELPILRAQLRRGNRLVPDEDVSLSVPWQESYRQGSFATKRPVLINQIDRIYSADPGVTKDMIRDTIIRQRRPGYAAGGLVSAGAIPYEPAKIDAIVNSLREELNA